MVDEPQRPFGPTYPEQPSAQSQYRKDFSGNAKGLLSKSLDVYVNRIYL